MNKLDISVTETKITIILTNGHSCCGQLIIAAIKQIGLS